MKHRSRGIVGEINITPLTDIFLVLLVIMMVVAPALNYRGLNMVLSADSDASVSNEKLEVLRISVDAFGSIFVGDRKIAPMDLAGVIAQEAAQKPDGVVIEVHPDAKLEAMTLAVDAVRAAGVTKVWIGPSSAEDKQAPTATPPRAAKQTPPPPHAVSVRGK